MSAAFDNCRSAGTEPGASPVILVVDDVPANRLVLGALLRKVGYQVIAAVSAHHALQQIAQRVPDLILLDIMMPGIDGYTLCRRLLAEPATEKVPVIFLSSLDDAVDKVKAFESGGADYVTKPFQAEEVLARVAHQLKIARLQRDLEHEKAELVRKNQMLLAAQRKAAMVFNSLTEILPGLVLDGKYRIDAKIGSGGFGVVYRATHLGLSRTVALKVFRPSGNATRMDALSRFQLEGISTCRVNHPNAVMILDSGISAQGIAYLVMELLDGPTLYFEMVRKRQLAVRRCLQIIAPVCDVLIAAHAAGIVHRDVKPENIMLHRSAGGEIVKVLDFGLAKLLGEDAQGMAPVVTGSNDLVGTPIYMAPERLEGNDYDGRADVYSVGVLLYEMLTGQVPFGDRDQGFLKIAHNHLHAQPTPLGRYRRDLSNEMAALVLRAACRDPEQRPTARQLLDELLAVPEWEGAERSGEPEPSDELTSGLYISVPSAAASELAEQWNGEQSDAFVNITAEYPRTRP